MENYLSKPEILSKIDTYEAINWYLKPYHNKGRLRQGQNISNPFNKLPQKTPSFNIFKNMNGKWLFKDFATGDNGDVIDLIMKLQNVNFKEALKILRNDFCLVEDGNTNDHYKLDVEDWNEMNLTFWSKYGINVAILKKFNVYSVSSFTRGSITIKSTEENPIYAYRVNANCYKIYQPYSDQYKFSWLGSKPKNYIFGLDVLPDKGNLLLITGGEKDVIALGSRKYNAISLNSETASIPADIIGDLKNRFKNIVVCYDLDKTGIEQSEKLAKTHGLKRLLLPDALVEKKGKDISDMFMLRLEFDPTVCEIETFDKVNEIEDDLVNIIKVREQIRRRKSEDISLTKPILVQNDVPILFPRTINIIQGKAGVHKSRLAETICSVFIKRKEYALHHLNFESSSENQPTVCYVDTERNFTEQFPLAIQKILKNAGYSREENPQCLDYISLLDEPRQERFDLLTKYLNHIRKEFSGHLIIILDVVTDCIRDFNRSDNSMELIDLMNVSINKYDVTFIVLIHENPGNTDKARGHLGTELMNKSSTVIQLGFEKGKNGKPTDLLCLNFLKTRSSKRPDTIYIKYSEESNGLILADESQIDEVMQARKLKARIDDVVSYLSENLKNPSSSRKLLNIMSEKFDCSEKIIRERLTDIISDKRVVCDTNGISCYLEKYKDGKHTYYRLKENLSDTEPHK